jgi:hypothetical protein
MLLSRGSGIFHCSFYGIMCRMLSSSFTRSLFNIMGIFSVMSHIRESQCRYPRIRTMKASVLSLRWVSRDYSNVLPIAHLGTSIFLCDTE